MANAKIKPHQMDFSALQLTPSSGWNRYINPINGKIRYWRNGTANGTALPSGSFQYVTTGIALPANTILVSCFWRVSDQALSVTPRYNGYIEAIAQSHYSSATPICDYYYELEQI